MIAMSLVFGLGLVLANPSTALGFFVALAVGLYASHANRFLLKVIIKNETTTRKHKDWLQVNAVVALIFSVLCIFEATLIINNPKAIEDAFKQVAAPDIYNAKAFVKMAIVLICFGVVLAAHVVWTYFLIKKYKAWFIDEQQ